MRALLLCGAIRASAGGAAQWSRPDAIVSTTPRQQGMLLGNGTHLISFGGVSPDGVVMQADGFKCVTCALW